MSSSKHPKSQTPRASDLTHNPGIGTSKGAFRDRDAVGLDGDNTFEGDVVNDTTPQGDVDPKQTGRTNK